MYCIVLFCIILYYHIVWYRIVLTYDAFVPTCYYSCGIQCVFLFVFLVFVSHSYPYPYFFQNCAACFLLLVCFSLPSFLSNFYFATIFYFQRGYDTICLPIHPFFYFRGESVKSNFSHSTLKNSHNQSQNGTSTRLILIRPLDPSRVEVRRLWPTCTCMTTSRRKEKKNTQLFQSILHLFDVDDRLYCM